ncbi:MAG: NAD(P)/FAD-dependent oxidoreductase [Candidatus Rokubacteria bacterium]|nr:NAD(P)/FAD-dependent oxidoreductase [Candidatus Rokubacteria bacterium]MBI3824437.1 NAD(P)/FAD-dependent oxidoreductase [Candidatus Rokubacteria bacterium]
MVDVVIVGGGPAGALAGITLARSGVRAVLLDKKRFPRDKPCGGGIRHSVFRRFPDLADHLKRSVELHTVSRVLMESPSGARVLAEDDGPLYLMLRRIELDAALLDRARAAGVEVVEEARVSAVRVGPAEAVVEAIDGRRWRARVVIGADGVNSIVARAAGLFDESAKEMLAIDTMEETEFHELDVPDHDTMYVAYGCKGWPGYGYVFPKARHVDAGVGFLVSFYKSTLDGSPYELHTRFLEEAAADGVVKGRSNRANFKAYRLPLGGPLARTHADRVLLCGDAASFVNAYTGEGIYYAMVTGEHAALAAVEALARGDCSAAGLAGYETRWRAEIGHELADSVRIQRRLFTNPGMADRVIRAASLDRRLCRLLARVALGEADLRDHRWEMAWRFAFAGVRARIRTRRWRARS